MKQLLSDAKKIIADAIGASLPDEAVKKALQNKNLVCNGKTIVISIGKAAWNMANAAAKAIPYPIDCGIIVTKYGHSAGNLPNFTIFEAGHPLPDENSLCATKHIIETVSNLKETDTVFFLVSGGGSALFEQPAGELTLHDILNITEQLLKCGADIIEINTIRKHLSAVKGGRFAEMCAPAQVFCIACSDILGDRKDSIASGPACADESTSSDAFAVVKKYDLTMTQEMEKQLMKETPKSLSNVTMEVTGSVTHLCTAAAKSAKSLGYSPVILTNMLDCEAKEAGKFLAAIAKTIQKDHLPAKPPCAIICGGETVVHVTGAGKGGRNQELALSAAEEISGMEQIVIAAVGSDGTDGPTDAAGGIVNGKTKQILAKKGISIPHTLAENNAYFALKEADSLIITGATGTNVNDLYFLLCK